jgi:thiamine pyrophosphokinase
MKRVLIFANGDVDDGQMVRQALALSAFVIAADGGARIAAHYDRLPAVVVGDIDSLSQQEQTALAEQGVSFRRYPPEKDETDLELALYYALEQGADWIRIVGGLGGRLDQSLANVYLLALPALHDCDVRLVAGEQEIRAISPGTHTISGHVDDTLSLIPLGGAVHGIQTQHLKYPLDRETLEFGPARGVSNVMTADEAIISLEEGNLLLIHTIGRA